MDYRKSHNFDRNVIAQNLADFGEDYDLSDDSVSINNPSSDEDEEEEEIELDELEKESLAAQSGVGEKRPSRALEQIMLMGMNLEDEPKAEESAPRRKIKSKASSGDNPAASSTSKKPHIDSYHKADNTREMLMQATKGPSRNKKSGASSWEEKIDDVIAKPGVSAAATASPGTRKKQQVTTTPPTTKTDSGTPAARPARRAKRSDMVKSRSEAHRTRHRSHAVSPGRPRHAGMQHRSQSSADMSPARPRHASMQHRSVSTGDSATFSPPRPRHASMQHRSQSTGDADQHNPTAVAADADDPLPRGSGHGRRRHVRRPSGDHNSGDADVAAAAAAAAGDDENNNNAPQQQQQPRVSGSHGRRRHVRRSSGDHRSSGGHNSGDADVAAAADDNNNPQPRAASGQSHGRRRHIRHTESNSGDEDVVAADDDHPQSRAASGQSHGRRRPHVRSESNSGDEDVAAAAATADDDDNDPLPRGSGPGRGSHRGRRVPVARRQNSAAARRPKPAAETNKTAALSSGQGAGLKW
mmetsp:Transcript_9261/g.22065  ORF Transcript_9261/g.22065 Transcript_9261/m.22065 type:complete len:526 (+) Transcript_9261:69-1646(+)